MPLTYREPRLGTGIECDIFIAPIPYNPIANPLPITSFEISPTAAIAIGAVEITVPALSFPVPEGLVLIFDNHHVTPTPDPLIRRAARVLKTGKVTDTTLSIAPLPFEVPGGTKSIVYKWLPIYSCSSADVEKSADTMGGSNWSSGWDDQFVAKRRWRISCSGFLDMDDPAFELLETYSEKVGRSGLVFVQIASSAGRCFQGRASIADFSYQHAQNDFVKVQFNFVGAGRMTIDRFSESIVYPPTSELFMP